MNRSTKAVVLGGSGFLGRRLVALISGEAGREPAWPRFDEVHVADVAPFVESPALRAALERTGITLTTSTTDITELDEVRAAVSGATVVFHLASIVDVGLAKNPRIDRINVDGAQNVAVACRDEGVKALVYTSSEDVVLSDRPIVAGDESLPYPTTIVHDYVRTKIEGERRILQMNGQGGLVTCAIRPVHIYGPEDPHAIEASLRALSSGTVPFRLGSGRARFDVVYVDNVAHGHLLAAGRLLDASSRESVAGKAFFIGEGYAPNYFDWLEPYAEARGISLPTFKLPDAGVRILARGMEWAHKLTGAEVPFHRFHYYVLCQDFFFSNERARSLLGYRPLVGVDVARERTLAWVKTLRIED